MPTKLLRISMIVVMATIGPGCASHEPPSQCIDLRGHSSDYMFYHFDDPRCSADQQRAIRAATKAVMGTDQPPASVAQRLHFSCTGSADGWSLTVWQFAPNEVPVPGGFTGVMLNR